MRSEPEPEQDAFRPRPLPSVDIALLPHERRAERVQRLVLVGTCVALVLGGLGVAFGPRLLASLGRSGDAPGQEKHDPAGLVGGAAIPVAPVPMPLSAEGAPPAVAIAPVDVAPAAEPTQATPEKGEVRDEPPANAEERELAAATGIVPGATDPSLLRSEHKFGAAKSFHDALMKAGASAAEANDLILALTKLVDFRKGKPEQTLVLERDVNHTLRAFEYRAGVTEVYRVKRLRDGKLQGERVDVPVERRRIAKGTQIAGSLGQALAALGLGPALAGAVIEAFDTKISFKKDTRQGDAVKLVVDEEYVDGQFLRYGNVLAIEYTGEKAGKQQAYWFDGEHGGEYYDPTGRAMHGGWLRTPLRYDHISSPYNLKRRHPILKRIMPHQGIDYSAGTGTPVWAAADGVVTFAGARGPNGNLVSIKHGNGYESHYAHLWRIGTGIKSGAHVKQRQVIGYVGTTGRSTGPHLHFALKRGGQFIDPATQLNGPGAPLPAAMQPKFRAQAQRLRAELDHIRVAVPTLTGPAHAGGQGTESGEDDSAEEEVDL